ncbi:hypothetical protein [Paenibacillus sp. J2TS4]|uniref:hypothetical protein n=1 Tax=Paenibacillus sp. J2TS4 TaxID=2807194 RepID=UPI001B15AE0E|nr:hypothetical protein [Paenibacillus sp. J2TS4]GIP32997.1 hypothetical protein J2TS4_22070 [Paenibacillus sp. J2TS4]
MNIQQKLSESIALLGWTRMTLPNHQGEIGESDGIKLASYQVKPEERDSYLIYELLQFCMRLGREVSLIVRGQFGKERLIGRIYHLDPARVTLSTGNGYEWIELEDVMEAGMKVIG